MTIRLDGKNNIIDQAYADLSEFKAVLKGLMTEKEKQKFAKEINDQVTHDWYNKPVLTIKRTQETNYLTGGIMEKARITKYIRRTPKPGGGWNYEYADQPGLKTAAVKQPEEKKEEKYGKPVKQTETPEFKKWFGDSKVVDEGGKPLVVYHGTRGDFDKFSHANIGETGDFGQIGSGFYFTDEKENAENYAKNSEGNGKEKILDVYLSIKNPYIQKKTIDSTKPLTENQAKKITDQLIKKGYDGIEYETGYGQKWYVAFSPTQIKSATGNSGKFDPNEADMTKAKDTTKLIKKTIINKKGQQQTVYVKPMEEKKEDSISIKSISDIKNIFDFFNTIGFTPIFGEQIISKESLNKSFEIEERIKDIKTNEIGCAINESGLIIFNKTGSSKDIELNKDEANKIRKSEIFIHNHTADKSLSCNDIMIAASLGIKKISAVFNDKKYSMEISLRKEKSNNNIYISEMFTLAKELASSYLESKKELSQKIKNNETTIEKSNKIESHLIIKKILKNDNINDLFLIKYSEE